MNAVAIVKELKARGVRFETQGERLILDAPKGALTAEEVERLRAHKVELLAVVTPASIRAEAETHTLTDHKNDEIRLDEAKGWTPDAHIPAAVATEIRRIEAEALALGWRAERLWRRTFWPHTHLDPRGLASVIDAGDRLIDVTADSITIEKSDNRRTRQRFWRADA